MVRAPLTSEGADSWIADAAGSASGGGRREDHEVEQVARPRGADPARRVGPPARPSGRSRTLQPGRCLTRWWRRQRHMRLAASVGPDGHGRTWSRSQNRAATEHPGKRQRPSRILTSAVSLRPGR